MSDSAHSRIGSRARGDDGFTLFLVMMVLLATSLFVAAGYAMANGDIPLSGKSRDRKVAFTAAEAGVNFYQFHLNQDNDYWLKCTNVAPPNGSEPSPVVQEWKNPTTDPDPRSGHWRNVPGTTAQYVIELLATGTSGCVQQNGLSMLDSNNAFRIRVTGRPSSTSSVRRSIIATYRRTGFLDFIYYTNYETLDPAAYLSSSSRTKASTYCAAARGSRQDARDKGLFDCTEIQFMSNDSVNGPLHSNDSLLICGTPTFGRDDHQDRITVLGATPGWKDACPTSKPKFKTPLMAVSKSVDMPPSNDELKKIAKPEYIYQGVTTIYFPSDKPGQMEVTNTKAGLNKTLVNVPSNGVVYVDNVPNTSCNASLPTNATYTDDDTCGNLYVSGSYSTSMTLAAARDIIIKPYTIAATGSSNGDLRKASGSDAVMGLVANNFVRVYHPVTSFSSSAVEKQGYMSTVNIDAAILTLQHSFIVDNYAYGKPLSNLNVTGAIAQQFRGPVGTGNGTTNSTGYIKNYWYDDRLKYRTPPYFLQPTSSSWNVIRFNEQDLPAR
jgi:hypothetical protein